MKYVSSTLTLLLAAAAAGPAAADLKAKAPRKNRKLAGKAATNPVDGAPRTQSSTLQKDQAVAVDTEDLEQRKRERVLSKY